MEKKVLFDSHCHLNEEVYDNDRDQVVARSIKNGVEYIFDIPARLNSVYNVIEYAKKNSHIFASIGIDMETCVPGSDLFENDFEKVQREVNQLLELDFENNKKFIQMVGETGIDLYWMNKVHLDPKQILDSLEKQKWLFQIHIDIANKYQLPLTIHSREAIAECLKILNEKIAITHKRIYGIFHSLTPETGDDESSFYHKVKEIHEAGFIVGLNGIVTFKNAHIIRNTVLKIIRENTIKKNNFELSDIYASGFVFETDGPFLSPEGKRGERNEPRNIKSIVEILLSYLEC